MLLLLLGCADPIEADPYADLAFPPAGPDAAPDASDWGPFPVGVTTLYLTDTERTLEDGSPRVVPVEVWYPAATSQGALRSYAVADFVPEERLKLEDIDPDTLPWLTSSSLDEAGPDTAHGPYPLVVFSHGNGGMRLQSLFFTEYLASHGYVVAAPDHMGNTLAAPMMCAWWWSASGEPTIPRRSPMGTGACPGTRWGHGPRCTRRARRRASA